MRQINRIFCWLVGLAAALVTVVGCAVAADAAVKSTPAPSLIFLDVQKFDGDLAASLEAGLERVEVGFYDPISPNQLPERIQKWVSATQAQGGRLIVQAPPGEPTPKNPLALIGLIGSAYSSAKALISIQQERLLASAKQRDIVMMLERDPKTQAVKVGKVAFVRRGN